nr:hypothetical protein [Tanacetum cinerariifolium]
PLVYLPLPLKMWKVDLLSIDHTDLDESQMSYGTKSSTSCDPKSVPNDSVSCDDSDKSSEDNTNDLAFSDSGLKSLEHKPTDSSCASTSSVSTSVNEAEIDSNVGTPTKEPISHFRKYSLSVSKLCFVCGSGTHLIKDCDFYEKQMTNTTVATPVLAGRPRGTLVPTGEPKATLVPTGKPKATEDEGIFNSGCSRSMTGNKDRLDDFQAIHGGKVTFGGGYKHVSANQSAGTQGNTTNSAGTQDVDSDSDSDEQVIIVPSYPSNNIQESHSIDTPGDKV